MSTSTPPDTRDSEAPIVPATYAPPQAIGQSTLRLRRAPLVLILLLAVLAAIAWFLLGAHILEVQVTPADAGDTMEVRISGGPSIAFGNRVLLHSGSHMLEVVAPGYETARQELQVDANTPRVLALALTPLPGRLLVNTTPAGAELLIDGSLVGHGNGEAVRLAAGEHQLRIEATRFITHETTLAITGRDELQTLEVTLAPDWGTYQIDSDPPGARILVDDQPAGSTPARIELSSGTHHLRLGLDGHRDVVRMVEAVAGEEKALDRFMLERADARLRITTRPAGASITLDGEFQGRAPLELAIDSSRRHELVAFKAGHDRATRVLPAGAGSQDIEFVLPVLSGEVQFIVEPSDARLLLDARPLAPGTRMLTLPGMPHLLRVEREGYEAQEVRFTPRPGLPQRIRVTLDSATTTAVAPAARASRERITSPGGQELVLLRPQPFTMGSSRREVGRRANETLHEIRMQRPFYLAVAEVSNAEFRRFDSTHDSGEFKGKALGGDDLPVVNVSWEDAALYCNWLSAQEGLPLFYRVQNRHVTGFDPASRGYRLPSEAEWAWAASVMADGSVSRFGWGEEMPPPSRAGNFADRSGATLLGEIIPGYDDGFPVAAPRRQFPANRHGIFDLDGNAAEWVNDVYEPLPTGNAVDPLGASAGELHVIRGASWRHGSITALRLAFRDYGKGPRPDLGFRIARYAE